MTTLSHKYDIYNRTEPAVIYLAKPGKRLYTALNGVDTSTVNIAIRTNDTAKLTFTINKYVNGEVIPEFDDVDEMMELYCSGIWFKIVDPPAMDNDSYQCTKDVTAESYEIGLSQYTLKNFNINNDDNSSYNLVYKRKLDKAEAIKKYPDRANDEDFINNYDSGNYYSVKLYDPNCKELSFLDLVLQHADVPGWRIGTVDHLKEASDANKNNSENASKILPNRICNFEVDDKSVFSFLTQEAATAYDCVFEFDTENLLINVHDIADFGKDTDIIIGFRNIQNKVSMSRNDSMITQFYVDGLDDYGIDQANYGSSILTDLSYFAREPYMNDTLAKKYKEWASYRYNENNIKAYMELSKNYNKQNEVLSELKNRVPVDTAQNDWFGSKIDDLITAYNDNVAIIKGLEALYVNSNGNTDFQALKNSSDWSLYESIMNYTIPAIVAAIQAKDDSDKKTASDKIGNNLNFKSYGNGNLLQNVNPVVMDKYWVPIGINLADINTTQLTYDPTKTPSGSASYGINRGISLVKKENGTFGLLQKKISITPDTKYTLSCFVKADAACTFYLGYRANGDNSDFTTKPSTLQQSNNWNLVSYTFSSKNHLIDVCFQSTNTCTFCGMQLELGGSATKFGYFIQSEDTMKSYETDWKLYGIDELETKIETYKNCIEELEKGGLNKPYQTGSGYEQDYANQMYRTYDDYKKLKVQAEAALRERQAEYNKVKTPQDNIQAKRVKFGEAILWNNYGSDFNTKYADCNHNHSYPKFTTEELLILKTLTRQATYTNENIITTSLTTTESAVDKCKELYDDAIDELYAESHPQYEYSDEVENIYALPEFKEYHDQLSINDFIYLEVMDDEYVKLRVTEISYNPCDMDESMELTFTSPTTYKTKRNDFNKILDAAINKSSHDGGTVQGVNKVSDASSYVISSDVIQRLFSNPVFSAKTTNMITGNSGDITANKIVTQLLDADEGVIKKLTSELVYSDYIKAKERYSIYNKSSEEYQDIIWYNQNSGIDFEDGLYIGLMGKIVGTVDPINAYLKFKDKDDTIYVHGNLDITDNKIQCTELQVLNKISLSGAITMDNNIKNAIKDCHSHNQIQTGKELALHVNSDRIEPYAYDEIAGWHTLGICEYAAASQAPYLGSASNMFQNLYLAGSIKSLGAWNSSISSGSSVYVNKDGIMRKYVASSSSMSIKNHIKEITYDDAKSLLNSRIYSFRYNPEMYSLDEISESKKDRYGFILEDLEKTFPMAVEHDKDGLPTSWCLQIVVPTHLAITKEHEIKITEHEREIEQLKSDNKKLQEEIILLKQQLCKEETHEISENQSER